MMIEPSNFRKVLGNYPTGVCAITAVDSDWTHLAMVVGSFTSVSLDPPLVGFFPDKRSSSWPKIERAGRFCANVLAADQQSTCRQLATPGGDKYANVSFRSSESHSPILDEAIAWIECSIENVVEAGDHFLVLGRVLDMDVNREADPLLFFRGSYGGFAERQVTDDGR